jgi:lipid II:glycine glycyltransferase (peptidoglycan interpeptide bridge formation enzyme)
MEFQIQVSNKINDPRWDNFVASIPSGHHVQTSLWGQVKAILNWKTRRILITEQNGNIVAGAQILMRSITPLFTVAYMTKGPVLSNENPYLTKTIIQSAIQVSRENRAQILAMQPPNNGTAMISLLSECGFQPSSLELAPVASLVLDLAQTEEQIIGQMKRQTRQNIHRSESEGVTVREGNANDLNAFYRLHIATSRRQKFIPYTLKYFHQLWDIFEPHGRIRLFIAEYNQVPISALLTIPFGNTVIAKILGWSGEFSQLRPNDAVFWHAIKWSKLHSYRYFDFEGMDVNGAKAILAGQSMPIKLQQSPDSLKLGYGGQVVLYPAAYEMIFNPVYRWLYSKLRVEVASQTFVSRILDLIRKR